MNQHPILRRCIACRKLVDRKQLWRVVRDFKDGVVLDIGMGRSAYLCQSQSCLKEAHRHKRLQKSLRCQVPVSIVEILQKRLSQPNDSGVEARLQMAQSILEPPSPNQLD